MLEIKNLSVVYPILDASGILRSSRKSLNALKDVSFNLAEGEIVGIVGESGCGKSTLGKAILRLVEGKISGKILYMGKDIVQLNEKELNFYRKDVQIIFQDPLASLNPKMLIKDIIAEPLSVFYPELSKNEIYSRVYDMMDKVGLSRKAASRYPHEFSGGQCQRIGIARAMILRPKILVCDEAVSALDVSIKAQIINLLQTLKAEYNMSVIFISHDLSVVKYISDRILIFYLGSLMEVASSDSIYYNPMHPYTKALISAIPDIDASSKKEKIILKGDIPSPLQQQPGCYFAGRCYCVQDKCRVERPEIENKNKDDAEHMVACFYPFTK